MTVYQVKMRMMMFGDEHDAEDGGGGDTDDPEDDMRMKRYEDVRL